MVKELKKWTFDDNENVIDITRTYKYKILKNGIKVWY